MKSFSIEDYRKLQTSGILSVPLTDQGWDEYLAFMQEIEVDYEEQARASLAYQKEGLLAMLPSEFHPYVQDGTINRPYTPPHLAKLIGDWNEALHERIAKQGQKARAAYEAIKSMLPPGAVALYEYSLHDAHFVSGQQSADRVVLELDLQRSSEGDRVQLIFTGVTVAELPAESDQLDWYGEEFELTENGFLIRILFIQNGGEHGDFVEIQIGAKDVIFDLGL